MRRTLALLGVAILALAGSAGAQTPERVTFDSAISVDLFRGDNTVDRPNIVVDIAAVGRLSSNWLVYVRPWLRQPRTNTWDKEIYQAALQYQRPGPIATRVDIGYIASPLGLGLMDSRPGVNPTILPHVAYFTPLPALESGAPRVMPLAATYPLGAEATVSGRKWDARTALLASAPTRIYMLGLTPNAPATPFVVVGGGVTPTTGLRFGASVGAGNYVNGDELKVPASSGRRLMSVGMEGEYTFGYTSLRGELIRDTFQTAFNDAVAYEWFVQGSQTLTPRWFVAGRTEGTSAPGLQTATTIAPRSVLHINEATIGFHLTPEIALRSSFVTRKAFTKINSDKQVGMSVVWTHRWW
jgi:hypothetical protein